MGAKTALLPSFPQHHSNSRNTAITPQHPHNCRNTSVTPAHAGVHQHQLTMPIAKMDSRFRGSDG